MNADRRKKLNELRDRLLELQDKATSLQSDLQDVLDEEQEYLDNMPDSLLGGEKAQKAESAIDAMQTVLDGITEFCDIDTGDLDTAAE